MNKKILVVCCLHGDEGFGQQIFDFINANKAIFHGVEAIIGNEKALKVGKRCIDQDLNRSFPGEKDGNHEQKLAVQLLEKAKTFEYILDVHTTTSNLRMTPIATELNEGTRKVLNIVDSKEVVLIMNGKYSLIGNVNCGVSFEFNEEYAATDDAFGKMVDIIQKLQNDIEYPERERKIFEVDSVIPKAVALPEHARNFQLIEELQVYPFLLYEKSYPEINAMSASTYFEEKI